MSFQTLIIETEQSADSFKSNCNLAPLGLDAVSNLAGYIVGVAGGQYPSSIVANVGAVKASGTITSTGSAANAETMTICGETLTAKTSGAVAADGEFNISATVATQATNIAAAINAIVALSGIVSATSALGVVTVTANTPGKMGNGLIMADVDLANVAVSSFANGSEGTTYAVIDQI